MATLSILGMYRSRPDIFDGLILPTAAELNTKAELITHIEPLDVGNLIGLMLMDLTALELVYPDADTMKEMIGIWCQVERGNWLRLWETILYKYNPIWNKDGIITEARDISREGTKNDTSTTGGTETETSSGGTERQGLVTDDGSNSESRQTGVATTTSNTKRNNVTGFDTDSYAPNDETVDSGTSSGNETLTGSGTVENTRNITDTETRRDSKGLERNSTTTGSGTSAESVSETYSREEHGNIGVTTTQQMIKEQREIVEFNLYKYITDSFKKRFCILIY